ncbi:phospholipase D family protein [Psychromonas sp.]|nr:phospholipase D family protein [Psychromonas sp.]
MPENTTLPSQAMPPSESNLLNKSISEHRQQLAMADDETLIVLLQTGGDSFETRIKLIEEAQESIDLQYYLFHADLSGELIITSLWNAAERGVRVRILVDDIDLEGQDIGIAQLNAHPNIEVRVFNPFVRGEGRNIQYVTGLGKVTRRMHNKSFTVDGTVAVLGGRNLADEYFSASEEVSFGDLDVVFAGKSVRAVQEEFDLYWNYKLSYNITLLADYEADEKDLLTLKHDFAEFRKKKEHSQYVEAIMSNGFVDMLKKGEKQQYITHTKVLYDNPKKIVSERDQIQYNLSTKLAPYVDAIKDELIIISPYFVPGKQGMAGFKKLVDRGVTVKILTNSWASNDVSLVHAGYSKYRKELLEMGVQLHEIDSHELDDLIEKTHRKHSSKSSKLSLHAKYYILDRHTTFIGSFNLDPRSHYENTEIGILTKSDELGRFLAEQFDRGIDIVAFKLSLKDDQIIWTKEQDGKIITFDVDPYTNWGDRFKNNFNSTLPIESQL